MKLFLRHKEHQYPNVSKNKSPLNKHEAVEEMHDQGHHLGSSYIHEQDVFHALQSHVTVGDS